MSGEQDHQKQIEKMEINRLIEIEIVVSVMIEMVNVMIEVVVVVVVFKEPIEDHRNFKILVKQTG